MEAGSSDEYHEQGKSNFRCLILANLDCEILPKLACILGELILFEELLGDWNLAIPKEIAVHPVLAFPVKDLVIRLECVRVFKTIAHSMCNDDRIEKLRLLEEQMFLS